MNDFLKGSEYMVEEDVKKILTERFGRRIDIISNKMLGGGCINHASRIESSEGVFFLKWNANGRADIFIREAECLTELKNAAGDALVIPEVVAVKEVDETPGFIVLEYLEPGHFLHNADEALGTGLAIVHKHQNKQFGFSTNNYCGATPQENAWEDSWLKFFRDNRLLYLLNLIQKDRPLPATEIRIYEKLVVRLSDLIPDHTKPALIHGDLWSGNYMISAEGPALIDPACSYADREMEFGIMTLFGGFSSRFYDAYHATNPLPAGWKERNHLYQLYHVLNHYYLFGGSYRHQALQLAKGYL